MFNYYPRRKVFSLMKTPQEEIQFSVGERNGKPFVDVRSFQIQEDGSKVWTHKGIYLFLDKLPEFKEGVERLIEASQSK